MSIAGLTIAAASQPRHRAATAAPRAPLTATQRAERSEEHEKTKAAEDACVEEWMTQTQQLAVTLGERFNQKPRYFLDRFFQGGARMLNHQEKINPFNAFKAFKAEEIRQSGAIVPNAPTLSETYSEEYNKLSKEKKDKLAADYKEVKADNWKIKRDTPRARSQDVANTVRNMIMLIQGLALRVGCEGLFLIVRNNADFYMEPQWFFTTPRLEDYMPFAVGKKWDLATVGAKVEAFAVAGCDSMRLNRTAKQKCDHLKIEIREMINKGLQDISKRPDIAMPYLHYREDVVVGLGIEFVGWTAGPEITNPSNLSSSVKVLQTLRDALSKGEARFVKLSRAEREERQNLWDDDVAAGRVFPKSREPRSDKGKKRKRTNEEDSDLAVHAIPDIQPSTSTPIIEEPATDPEPPRPAKRSRKTVPGPSKKSAASRRDKENTRPVCSKKVPRNDATTQAAIARQKTSRQKDCIVGQGAVDSDSASNAGPIATTRMASGASSTTPPISAPPAEAPTAPPAEAPTAKAPTAPCPPFDPTTLELDPSMVGVAA